MKLSKTTLILLVAGVFLILGIGLFLTRTQQTDQQTQLENNLKQANIKLAQIKIEEMLLQKEKLVQQIGSYDAQTAETKKLLSYSGDSIDTTGIILEEAQKQGMDIEQIVSPGITIENIGGNTCETLLLNIKVKGTIQNIAGFISGLSQAFPTSVIKSVQLNVQPEPTATPATAIAAVESAPEGAPAGAPAGDFTVPVSTDTPEKNTHANINLVIYDYKGK